MLQIGRMDLWLDLAATVVVGHLIDGVGLSILGDELLAKSDCPVLHRITFDFI